VRLVGLSLLLFSAAACGGGAAKHSIAASEFDRACTDVVDCVPVYEGALSCCSNQPCSNAAIRQDALAIYAADVTARTPMCQEPFTPGSCLPGPVCTGRVACTNGLCVLESPSGDGGARD
jgi:hypothetical protein